MWTITDEEGSPSRSVLRRRGREKVRVSGSQRLGAIMNNPWLQTAFSNENVSAASPSSSSRTVTSFAIASISRAESPVYLPSAPSTEALLGHYYSPHRRFDFPG